MEFPEGHTLPVPTSIEDVRQLTQSLNSCLGRFDVPHMLGEVTPNPHLSPSSALFNAWQRGCALSKTITKGQEEALLVFHGTHCDWNIHNICQNGFDPSRRHSQGLGSGEYFHATCAGALNYSAGTNTVIATLVLVSPFTKLRNNNTIAVVNNPPDPIITFSLPIFTIHYSADSLSPTTSSLTSDFASVPLLSLEPAHLPISTSMNAVYKTEEGNAAQEAVLEKDKIHLRSLAQIYPQPA